MESNVNGGKPNPIPVLFRRDGSARTAGAVTQSSTGGYTIADTATTAKVGDVYRPETATTSVMVKKEYTVIEASTNSFTIASKDLPTLGDTFYILGRGSLRVGDDGAIALSTVGLATEAKQDTQITSLQLLDDAVGTDGSASPTKGYAVGGTDGTNFQIMKTDTSGRPDVTVQSSALPSGAATEAKQDAEIAVLNTIDGRVDGLETLIGSTNTKLDTVNTNLGTIDGRVDGLETLIGSTNTKLDTVNTNLGTIDGHVDGIEGSLTTLNAKDFATQTTLAAVLAKIIAAPATEAKQDTGNTSLSTIAAKDFATQTTLAAVLAKIIAAPATEAKQDTMITSLQLLDDVVSTTGSAVPTKSNQVSGTDGTNARVLKTDSNGELQIDVLTLPATPAGSNVIGKVGVEGKISANAPARNDYSSVNVTTGAYVELVASTTSATTEVEVLDSSGQTLAFAVGAAASEVIKFNIFPGGNGRVPLAIPAGSRVAIKAVSATASVGEINVNFYG